MSAPNEREMKLRCLELAARLIMPERNVDEVIRVGSILYASLPPGPGASKVKQHMAKSLAKNSIQRESRPGQSQA